MANKTSIRMSPQTTLNALKGVGLRTAEILGKAGLVTVQDILENYPHRYENYSQIKKIAELKPGSAATVVATVKSIFSRKSQRQKKLSLTQAVLSDETGSIEAVWFNQPYLVTSLKKGQQYFFSGEASLRGRLQLNSPQFEDLSDQPVNVGRLVPVYSLPEGVSPKRYRGVVYDLLKNLPKITDYLPLETKKYLNLIDLNEAWRQIHFPTGEAKLAAARKRLAFDELFLLQLKIARRRQLLRKTDAPSIPFKQESVKKFVEALPFKLTFSQKKAAWEIIQDLESRQPMNRLLQGDVGSGKTVVAAIAAFSASLAGYQTAFLAPTEILCQQHYQTLKNILEPHKIVVSMLTGGSKQKDRQKITEALAGGRIKVIVGTHALLGGDVKFKNLGLIVVDEQHRFGVNQRAALARREITPAKGVHYLSMTATPIPRTLALTLYGDLSISSITELPPGRQAVKTQIVTHGERQKAYALVRKEILLGRQGFIICPLLEESDALEIKSAKQEHERLSKNVFPSFSLGLIHGRMKSEEKDRVMKEFKNGVYQILVSTSVVEVGIDVPNATVVLIEGAERFGLAQLHQFRGRVGRGDHPSYCLLVPSNSFIPERLQAICEYHDGFKLAELDLKFRGMGEIAGLRQSGFLEMKIADPTDLELIKLARQEAEKLTLTDPELTKNPQLLSLLRQKEAPHPE